jgi:dihydrofolate synthase/folylpolyglutamate synthase
VNVVDADVSLIASISLDHCDWLGNDVETIGREKAGIFRSARPAVFAAPDMPMSIQDHADQLGARLLRLNRDFGYSRQDARWSFNGLSDRIADLPAPALYGDVQFDNASAVLMTLELLRERLPVTRDAIVTGLSNVRLAGRFQRFPREAEWILDVAHNPAAASTLAAQLARVPGRKIAVCGILADKDIDGIVSILRDSFSKWIVAGLEGERAVAHEALATLIAKSGANVAAAEKDVISACARAQREAGKGDVIVVFGSFLTVAPALSWLTEPKLS